ncbi:MAG TPA: hypothetical protein VIY48_11445 [Candidatus Paceibacterota bacterium]
MSDKTDDDQGYFIPGIYMMSTKEALEAGFISYDKPTCTVPAGGPNYSCPAAPTDVEKLIERLKSEYHDYDCHALRLEAAAMLRSLSDSANNLKKYVGEYASEIEALRAEKAKVEEEIAYYLKRITELGLEVQTLRAKLERAQIGLVELADRSVLRSVAWTRSLARATLEEISPSPEA